MGQSLPWLAGGVLGLAFAGWYLFMPSSSAPDAGQLAFGQEQGFGAVQSGSPPASARPGPAPLQPVQVPEPAPVQTGGLNVPAAALPVSDGSSSVPEDVVKLIREGRAFETANREAITRLSDTVRAQSAALAALQSRLDGLASDNSRLANQLTVLGARPAAPSAAQVAGGRTSKRTALSGMRLEGLQDGMAWVSWQGRTWAVQPGDSLGAVTVHSVNVADRSVTTSAGVLR
jgi:intracellular multiplication protein IcmG